MIPTATALPHTGQSAPAAPSRSACPRPVGPLDGSSAEVVVAALPTLPIWLLRTTSRNSQRLRGARRILDWLLTHPGDGWQDRWLLSGADTGPGWIDTLTAADQTTPATRREVITDGLACLLLQRVILPSYQFLHRYPTTALFRDARRVFSPDLFERVAQAGRVTGHGVHQQSVAESCLVKILLHTGRDLGELTAADLLDYRDWGLHTRGKVPPGVHAAWDLLRDVDVLSADLPLRRTVGWGQLSTAQMVDRYRIHSAPIREVFIRYLDQRRPGLDYSSLQGLASRLVGNFWADIQRHHPDLDTLHLPADVAQAWRQRTGFVIKDGQPPVPRQNRLGVLVSVRAFYLDIAHWALEDATWARWAAPSPVRQADLAGFAKNKKTVQARMHQRVRERLPRLPDLLDAVDRYRTEQTRLLAAAEATAVGQEFAHQGRHFRRIGRDQDRTAQRLQYRPSMVLIEDTASGEQHDLTRDEDEAFWSWAIIETLRHTGIRVEELLEITHLALVSYQLPDSREVVPLLQIVPSKSNEERLLLVSPELASVLATIINRLRNDNDGAVPLVARYDSSEHTTGPALPHLFQRRIRWKRDVMTYRMVCKLLNDTISRSGLTDHAGAPLRFTPHDFRRIFTTEAVSGGLPVHIAARLLGHASITTTQSYLAVFQDDLIRAYRTFLDARRAVRPTEEYREPTDAEWREFQQHFHARKLELGECARPYGAPCQHEHACLRCPMLRVSPTQRARLVEIIHNLTDRITEARMNGWLGEVQGLQVSLTKASQKLANLDRGLRRNPTGPTEIGMPIISDAR